MVRYGGKGGKYTANEVIGEDACSVSQVLIFIGNRREADDLVLGVESSKYVLTGFEKLV